MSIRVSVLGSGSRGNATFIATGRVKLLIDCGFGPRVLQRRLAQIGEDIGALDAVLVTHEHTDHVGGLPALMRAAPLAAYMSSGTIGGARLDSPDVLDVNALDGAALVPVTPGRPFAIGDLEVHPFAVPHDAEEPTAFSVVHHGVKITQLTDLGWISGEVAAAIAGSHVLILESNHDVDMLRMGPYPWPLKERLLGRRGHLSNTTVSHFLGGCYDGMAQHVILAHLSSQNNHPEIARLEACQALAGRGWDPGVVSLASQDTPSPLIEMG